MSTDSAFAEVQPMAGQKVSYIRWTPDEYLRVAVNALPYLTPGDDFEALRKGMRLALHRSRWRPDPELRSMAGQAHRLIAFHEAMKKAEKLSEREREKYRSVNIELPVVDEPPFDPASTRSVFGPKPKGQTTKDEKVYTGDIRWNDREKALLARRVLYWQQQGNKRPLSRLYIEAQEIELPPERRRSRGGLYQANGANAAPSLSDYLAQGKAHLGLIVGVPFDPARAAYEEPAAPAPAPAPVEPEPVAAPPPPPEPPQAPEPVQATTPPTPVRSSIAEAAKAFGDTVMGALERLLTAHEAALMSQVQERLDGIALSLAGTIAAQLRGAVASTVQRTIEQELGGPVAAPVEAPPPPPPEPEPEQASKVRPPGIDVIGLPHTGQQQIVKDHCNGHVDLRFIHKGARTSWHYEPHNRMVVLINERVPHKVSNKIKTSGVRVALARPTAESVIKAVESLTAEG